MFTKLGILYKVLEKKKQGNEKYSTILWEIKIFENFKTLTFSKNLGSVISCKY